MTREEMLARISSRELSGWMAYAGLEPFGEAQMEYRAGLIASTVANTARDEKKQKIPFQPADFMRAAYKNEPAQSEELTPEMLMQKIDAAMMLMGGARGNPS